MTTETIPDPIIEAWSDNLEEDLVEAGMERPQAKAYRHAFELGMARVMSQFATKQDLRGEIASVRQELKDEIASVRQDIRDLRDQFQREIDRLERWLILIGAAALGMLGAILAIVA